MGVGVRKLFLRKPIDTIDFPKGDLDPLSRLWTRTCSKCYSSMHREYSARATDWKYHEMDQHFKTVLISWWTWSDIIISIDVWVNELDRDNMSGSRIFRQGVVVPIRYFLESSASYMYEPPSRSNWTQWGYNCFSRGARTSISKETYSHW